MHVDYFQIWLDHKTAEEIIEEKREAEREQKLESTGYHVNFDITGETVGDFFRNIITDYVQIGYSGTSDLEDTEIDYEQLNDELTDMFEEFEGLDFDNEEVVYQNTEVTKRVMSAIPVPNWPRNFNPGWMKWAQDQFEQRGYETDFYIEGEGQGSKLSEALEETGYNTEMGIEVNGQERYSLAELNDVLY